MAPAVPRFSVGQDYLIRGLTWVIMIVVTLGVWEFTTRSQLVNPVLLAPPADVYAAMVDLLNQESFWGHVWVTTLEIALGWGIAVTLGLFTAVMFCRFARLERAAMPYVVTLQALPKVVLLPLFTVILGLGMGSTIALIVISAFLPTFLNTVVGLKSVSPSALRLMDSLRASSWDRYRRLMIPHAAPYALTGMQSSMVIAALAAIIGEFYGARYGIGYVINSNAFGLRIAYVYAAIVAVSILSLTLFGVVAALRRALVPWYRSA